MARKAGPKESEQVWLPMLISRRPSWEGSRRCSLPYAGGCTSTCSESCPVAPVWNSLAGPFYPSLKGSHQIFWQEP